MKRTIFLLTLLAAVTMSAKAYVPGDYFSIFYLHSIKCNTTILIKSNCSVNNSSFYNATSFSYFIKLSR